MNGLTLKPKFALDYGLANPILFNYGKGLIMLKVHESEVYSNYDANEQRVQAIEEGEKVLREALREMSILNEHHQNL